MKAIKELNYVRSAVARSMILKKTKTIGVIIPDVSNPFFGEVVAGIENNASKKDYFATLSISNESTEKESKIIQHFMERGVDGVIVTTANENGNQIKPLMDLNIPVVAVDRMINNFEVDTVLIGNREGSYEATCHLINQGHKKIAIISGPQDTTPGNERYKGFCQALNEYNLEIKDEWVGDGDFTENSGYNLTMDFFQFESKPTAIFSSNNLMSIGSLKALSEMNLKIGKDISFVGFDDIELATFLKPQLTMVSRPMKSIGEIAFQLLYDRITEGSNIRNKREYILSPRLIVRDSGSFKF